MSIWNHVRGWAGMEYSHEDAKLIAIPFLAQAIEDLEVSAIPPDEAFDDWYNLENCWFVTTNAPPRRLIVVCRRTGSLVHHRALTDKGKRL